MIPLRDLNPTRRPAVVVWSLIAASVAVFAFELYLEFGRGAAFLKTFVFAYGVVPARLFATGDMATILSSMFLHGGVLHLLGNMWFLGVFGDNVEDRLGHARFLAFYVFCGVAAALTQSLLQPSSAIPMVGASGAIAGVLAAYVRMFPRARIVTLIPIFIFMQFVELPAFLFIFVWFGMQLLHGTLTLGTLGAEVGGVAFFAHVGGFVAGLFAYRAFLPGPAGERRSTSSHGRRVTYRPRER